MKVVFLAGPFRGDGSEEAKEKNIALAREFAEQLMEAAIFYYSPHLNLSVLRTHSAYRSEYAVAMHGEILTRCDILAVLPGWETSGGTKDEIAYAEQNNLPIVYLENEGAVEELQQLVSE